MNPKLLDILACPLCKSPLHHDKGAAELICKAERLAYPIRGGVPILIEAEARTIPLDDPR